MACLLSAGKAGGIAFDFPRIRIRQMLDLFGVRGHQEYVQIHCSRAIPYSALVVRKGGEGAPTATCWKRSRPTPYRTGAVTIRVAYSSLNYKDALSISGHPGVTRKFPHVPGIDAAGVVVASTAAEFPPGMEVITSGFEFGSGRWGGYAAAHASSRRMGCAIADGAERTGGYAARHRRLSPRPSRCWRSSNPASRRRPAMCSSLAQAAA